MELADGRQELTLPLIGYSSGRGGAAADAAAAARQQEVVRRCERSESSKIVSKSTKISQQLQARHAQGQVLQLHLLFPVDWEMPSMLAQLGQLGRPYISRGAHRINRSASQDHGGSTESGAEETESKRRSPRRRPGPINLFFEVWSLEPRQYKETGPLGVEI